MALSMFIFAAVDTQGKYLTESLHPFQVVWARQLGLGVAALALIARHGLAVMRTDQPKLQLARGVLGGASAACFIAGVSIVPLATAMTVTFVAPFLVTVLAALILREAVGLRRWIAVGVGFLGTLVVIRPGLGQVEPAVLLVLFAAFLFSLRQIASRALSSSDRTITTVAYTGLTSLALLSLSLPFVWQTPSGLQTWAMLAGIAVLAGVGEILLIRALEIGLAVVVAPMQYTILVWGTVYGWLIWGHIPDFWTWVGAAIIISTGVYIARREWLAYRAG